MAKTSEKAEKKGLVTGRLAQRPQQGSQSLESWWDKRDAFFHASGNQANPYHKNISTSSVGLSSPWNEELRVVGVGATRRGLIGGG